MKKLAVILALAFSSQLSIASSSGEDKIVWVAEDDPNMNAAITKARSSLDGFLKRFRSKPINIETYKLKVMLSDNNGVEHFWITPFSELGDNKFEGIVANDPQIVTSVKVFQKIEFSKDQITDWGYEENGKQIGSFTVCALFTQMPEQQVKFYKENHGFVCDETQQND